MNYLLRGGLMNKEKIYEFLKSRDIWYEITEHDAVYNMEELAEVSLPYPEYDAKNIFVCDDKKNNYYLISVKNNKRVDLKKFRKDNNTRPLSFVREDALLDIMNLKPGSVGPFGILNDDKNIVQFYLDKEFLSGKEIIGIHPNDNRATVWLKVNDLLDIIKEHGNNINIVEI